MPIFYKSQVIVVWIIAIIAYVLMFPASEAMQCVKSKGMCTVEKKNIIGFVSKNSFRIDNISKAYIVEMFTPGGGKGQSGHKDYYIDLSTKSGEVIKPFHSSISYHKEDAVNLSNNLNTFLRDRTELFYAKSEKSTFDFWLFFVVGLVVLPIILLEKYCID